MSFGWKYWYIKFTVKVTYLKFYFTKKRKERKENSKVLDTEKS